MERVDVVATVRSLRETVRARADEIEARRRIPDDLARTMARAGLYRTCVPEAYGGLELPPMETMRAIELMAQADASCAWCMFIGATTGSAIAYLPERTAREVFSRPETILAGVFAPSGTAVAVDGGYRVSGRWQWGSGTENADWVMGGSRIVRNGQHETTPTGLPRSHMMIVPAAEVHFEDTWHVMGLAGTGSTHFELRDVFVPADRAVDLAGGRPLARPLYAFPNFGLLALGIASVSLGLARAAIDELLAIAAAKVPAGSTRSLAQRPQAQADVAQAEAGVRAARSFLFEAIEAAWSAACETGRMELSHRRDLRLATTWATRSAARAVDRMYELAGGTSVYDASPLQRIFRDVHVATQHMMVSESTYELTGRLLLGLETDTTFL